MFAIMKSGSGHGPGREAPPRAAGARPGARGRHRLRRAALLLAVLAAGTAASAPIPTFAQLDKELGTYKPKAHLEGASNAHLQSDGLAFYSLFDLFLTVINNPADPRHAETRRAWDHNYETFQAQAGFVARFMGKNLIPLLITTSELYAKSFRANSKFYAPGFRAEDYLQPLSTEVLCDGKADRVAWWHGLADADGDKTSNADELRAVAPDWQKKGVTDAARARFVREAASAEIWFAAVPDGGKPAEDQLVAETKR